MMGVRWAHALSASISRRRWSARYSGSIRLWLKTAQEDRNDGLDMLVVRQPVGLDGWQEQLAPELGKDHVDEGPRAGPHVVGPQPAEFELACQLGPDEAEHGRDHPPSQRVGDLWPPDHVRND